MFTVEIKRIFIVLVGAVLNAVSLNLFLIEANVYASGFTGIAQLMTSVLTDFLGIRGLSTGLILFILNIPVAILGWYKVGRGFTVYSAVSVAFTTLFLEIIPIEQLSNDIILNAVFGGVLGGMGVGITLKWGASTGGLDIIAMILSRMKDRPIGTYFLFINGAIIVIAGFLYEPENALYTLLTLYVTTRVIDAIHTRHEKLTAMIITNKAADLEKSIHAQMVRGITTLPARGAFTQQDKHMLVMVITRYELYDLQHIISEVDPQAFTNIVQTTGIFGFFRKDDK
ncbi:YitT family protein [Halobacillus yeomjeoni]|uniref:YitT family protein n=1 Tax=Halobacillus yeomjeoni TaxID=311194 RepID=A0A931MTA3_9BACI|nr:YitT family protein [Halobacillus yeomjeoni]MBH0228763.1 YitT family protein [Halobacillus yeomjeoni]